MTNSFQYNFKPYETYDYGSLTSVSTSTSNNNLSKSPHSSYTNQDFGLQQRNPTHNFNNNYSNGYQSRNLQLLRNQPDSYIEKIFNQLAERKKGYGLSNALKQIICHMSRNNKDKRDIKDALERLKEMTPEALKEIDNSRDKSLYSAACNAALSAYCKTGDDKNVIVLFEEMRGNETLTFNKNIYVSVINSCGNTGNLEALEKLEAEIQNKNQPWGSRDPNISEALDIARKKCIYKMLARIKNEQNNELNLNLGELKKLRQQIEKAGLQKDPGIYPTYQHCKSKEQKAYSRLINLCYGNQDYEGVLGRVLN